jgi:Ala-tRNA(Pro) deacylase
MDNIMQEDVNSIIERVLMLLKDLEIEYKLYNHEAVFTIEDIDNLDMKFEGMYCKNLFLRNSKGDVHYLLIIEDSKKADLRKVARDVGSTRLSFASDERLYKYLALRPGSVTPFGLINDLESGIIVLLDSDLVGLDKINFHPNTNKATITVSYEGLRKFLEHRGNRVSLIDL